MNGMIQPADISVRIFPDGRMTAADAAAYCGVSYKTLALQRCQGSGPPYIKLGKSVFYTKDALDQWIAENCAKSTAEYRAKRKAA